MKIELEEDLARPNSVIYADWRAGYEWIRENNVPNTDAYDATRHWETPEEQSKAHYWWILEKHERNAGRFHLHLCESKRYKPYTFGWHPIVAIKYNSTDLHYWLGFMSTIEARDETCENEFTIDDVKRMAMHILEMERV